MRRKKPSGILFIMVGPPGVGKSTIAKEITRRYDAVRVEVDSYRERIFGGMDMGLEKQYACFSGRAQEFNSHIHAVAMGSCIPHLQAGRNVVYDGTNTNPQRRALLVRSLKNFTKEVIVFWVTAPLAECLERNRMRSGDRRVPDAVIKTKWAEVHSHPPDQKEQGVDQLIVIDSSVGAKGAKNEKAKTKFFLITSIGTHEFAFVRPE